MSDSRPALHFLIPYVGKYLKKEEEEENVSWDIRPYCPCGFAPVCMTTHRAAVASEMKSPDL